MSLEKKMIEIKFSFTMVLDVVELQELLINHDHHLLNVWDYEMKQPIKKSY